MTRVKFNKIEMQYLYNVNKKTSHQVLVTHETFQNMVVYYRMILVDILTRICARHFELCIWLQTRTHLNSQFVWIYYEWIKYNVFLIIPLCSFQKYIFK